MRAEWKLNSSWRGDELFARKEWRLQLTESMITEIDRALKSVSAKPLEDISKADFVLPTLAALLQETQDILEHGCGTRYLQGFPVDRYGDEDLKRIFWGLAQHLGTPISQSAKGEKLFSVRDEGFGLSNEKSRGPNTSKGLSFHTDRCDVIGFFCLKQAISGGENYLISSSVLYNEIHRRRPDLLAALHKPYYYLRHNIDTANPKPYITQPVFAEYGGRFMANLLRVLINRAEAHPDVPNLEAAQVEALDFLEEVAADPKLHVSFRQEPGDLLFVNNWELFHSRSAFEDHEDREQRRHLLRIWLSMPNSRALPESYRGNYLETAAGAIRGGIHPPK